MATGILCRGLPKGSPRRFRTLVAIRGTLNSCRDPLCGAKRALAPRGRRNASSAPRVQARIASPLTKGLDEEWTMRGQQGCFRTTDLRKRQAANTRSSLRVQFSKVATLSLSEVPCRFIFVRYRDLHLLSRGEFVDRSFYAIARQDRRRQLRATIVADRL